MKWTVIWLPDAEQELADLWLNSADRAAVTQSSHIIDSLLKQDPETVGESRDGNRRILLVAPLGVIYRVLPDDRRVEVLHVWRY
jgi:plasmid stabilization system protein ParE